ncbi:MAG TPA: dihydrofolate reductase family protein [Polyangiaceae bacterium]
MKRLILKMSISMDGFVGGPNGEMDWVVSSQSDDGKKWVLETLREAGTHVLGHRTYPGWAKYWPTSKDVLAAPMNEIPKVVFSRTATPTPEGTAIDPSWERARIVSGDLAEQIARLKREPGKDLLASGGAGFARSLVAAGLVDEYRLVVHPVVLGKGLALFADLPAPLHLDVVETTTFSRGAIGRVLRPRR